MLTYLSKMGQWLPIEGAAGKLSIERGGIWAQAKLSKNRNREQPKLKLNGILAYCITGRLHLFKFLIILLRTWSCFL